MGELIPLAGEVDPTFVEMMEDFLRKLVAKEAKLCDWIGIIYYLERPKALPLRPVVSMIGSYLSTTNRGMQIPLDREQSGLITEKIQNRTLHNGQCNRNRSPASLL